MARATEMAAIIKASENPSIAPRRILGEKKNSTRIKNMTEMYNNIPAPDYMKQLAKIIGMD